MTFVFPSYYFVFNLYFSLTFKIENVYYDPIIMFAYSTGRN